MATTVLKIDGMSCDHCVRTLTKALEGVKGVSKANVSLEQQRAVVEHSEGSPTLEQLIGAVEEEGYSASAA